MAREFENGVQYFLMGELRQKVGFANGITKCSNCDYSFWEKGLNRARCTITKNIIHAPDYPELPGDCPIELTGEIVGTPPK